MHELIMAYPVPIDIPYSRMYTYLSQIFIFIRIYTFKTKKITDKDPVPS